MLCLPSLARVALLVSLGAEPASAQTAQLPDLNDVMQARNFGMAGAYRALGYGAEAIDGNPAAMSLYKRYALELSGAWDATLHFGLASVAVTDSTTEVAAGLSYHFVTYGPDDARRSAHLTTLALSMPLTQFLHLGLSGRHQVIVGPNETNSITMSAGLLIKPVDFLSVSLSVHNFIDVFHPDVPRYFALSVSGMFGLLTPVFDMRVDTNEPVARFAFAGGVEWIAAGTFPLRLGYAWDGIAHTQFVSGGLGYFSEGSGIDFSYRHELGGNAGRMLALTFKMQF